MGLAMARFPSEGWSCLGKIGLASEKVEADRTAKRKHATRRNFIDDIFELAPCVNDRKEKSTPEAAVQLRQK
jgi:hypothetical protein